MIYHSVVNQLAINGYSKKKLKADGIIDKYKARLVAKGYHQKEGFDYFDTYSPVLRIVSIRTLIAISAQFRNSPNGCKNRILNGELDEEIYMEQPKGFVIKGQGNKVCNWHEKFGHNMLTHGFKINECDKCVHIKSNDNSCVIVCLYVDDILIMGSNNYVIIKTKKMSHSSFDMKDLGLSDVILGIQLKRNSEDFNSVPLCRNDIKEVWSF